MRQFRIVSEPNHTGGIQYKVQSKGCNWFSFFWTNEGHYYAGQIKVIDWHTTLKSAETRMKNLRHYWNGKSKVVKTCGCDE